MSSKESTAMEVDTVPPTDTQNTEKSVMAPGTVGSVTCSLHPLVIMNVSEHWTREKAQEGSIQQGKPQSISLTTQT